MSEHHQPPRVDSYRCPGQQHPISRAVHLGRLAAFYPPCRQCVHGGDTGTLSPRQVEKLREVQARGGPRSLFHEEGAGGVYLNDLTPKAAREIAAAFAAMMLGSGDCPNFRGHRGEAVVDENGTVPFGSSIILGSDGRAITAEVTAAVGKGLRYGGCDVIDIGPATAACLAFATGHFNSAGGILVGNPGREAHSVVLQFWTTGPRPLSEGAGAVPIFAGTGTDRQVGPQPWSAKMGLSPLSRGAGLESIAEHYQTGVDRPARGYGDLRRAAAAAPYLDAIKPHYHALRPLRVLIDSASRQLVEYLRELAAMVACQVIPSRVARHDVPQQVRNDAAHLAVTADGDGETCQVLDEQGRAVAADRLLLLLARSQVAGTLRVPSATSASGDASYNMESASEDAPCSRGSSSVVVEAETSQRTIEHLERAGLRVVTCGPRRADMAAAMSRHDAVLGGGPTGRLWHPVGGVALPDALMTVTRLLELLSRSDEPFSTVLDRDAPLD